MTKRLLAYSKKEAVAATSLSVRGIDYLIEKGQLRAVKIGRRVLIPSKELEKLVERGPNPCQSKDVVEIDARMEALNEGR